jgi:hypothetical protein
MHPQACSFYPSPGKANLSRFCLSLRFQIARKDPRLHRAVSQPGKRARTRSHRSQLIEEYHPRKAACIEIFDLRKRQKWPANLAAEPNWPDTYSQLAAELAFPAAGDDPYAYLHVRDHPVSGERSRTRVTVPLTLERLPADGRLRALVSQLVQIRPVLEDPERLDPVGHAHPPVSFAHRAPPQRLGDDEAVGSPRRAEKSRFVRAGWHGGRLPARDAAACRG